MRLLHRGLLTTLVSESRLVVKLADAMCGQIFLK